MEKKRRTKPSQLLSSLLMLFMLAWLTVCLPYVNESRESANLSIQLTGEEAPDADDSNPLTNTNEEKSESGASLFSEYLHPLIQLNHAVTGITSHHKIHPSDLYLAYHPELIIPPPEA